MPLIKTIAIQKCDRRLELAREAFAHCVNARVYPDFEKYWTRLLSDTTACLNILEKAALSDPKAKAWYHRKRNEGRNDPLVRYMLQARNTEEHGIEAVTALVHKTVTIGAPGQAVAVNKLVLDGNLNIVHADFGRNPDGRYPEIKSTPAHPRLIPVHDDRSGKTFQPPVEHMGVLLNLDEPTAALRTGSIYLAYVSALVREAEALI